MEDLSIYLEQLKTLGSCLKDSVCVLIRRTVDKRFALQNYGDCGWFLPFKYADENKTWETIAQDIVKVISSSAKFQGIIEIVNTEYHNKLPPATKIVFFVEAKDIFENAYDISWFSSEEMQSTLKYILRAFDPVRLSNILHQSSPCPLAKYSEFRINSLLIRDTEEIDALTVPYKGLLESAGFSLDGQKVVYYDFMCHVYPCHTMNFHLFKKYLRSFNWWTEEVITENWKKLFRSFDVDGCGHLTYNNILLGLAALDLNAPHGGNEGETRCRYIFKYYDTNNDNIMELSEIRQMLVDINLLQETPLNEAALDKAVEDSLKVFEIQEERKLSLDIFLEMVGHVKFRGTSLLFRSPEPVLEAIIKKIGSTAPSEISSGVAYERPGESSSGSVA